MLAVFTLSLSLSLLLTLVLVCMLSLISPSYIVFVWDFLSTSKKYSCISLGNLDLISFLVRGTSLLSSASSCFSLSAWLFNANRLLRLGVYNLYVLCFVAVNRSLYWNCWLLFFYYFIFVCVSVHLHILFLFLVDFSCEFLCWFGYPIVVWCVYCSSFFAILFACCCMMLRVVLFSCVCSHELFHDFDQCQCHEVAPPVLLFLLLFCLYL